MKNLFFFILIIFVMSSCKKEERYNPDQHIIYSHLYKLSGSADTLFSVYIPSAFTPNGDGINDFFYAKGYFHLADLKIFNREGKIVFETTNPNFNWNGTMNNSSANYTAQEGNYTYQLKVKDTVGVDYEYLENLMLYK